MLFGIGLLVGGFVMVVFLQFDRFQAAALKAVGISPTETPFASTWAERGTQAFANGDVNGALDDFSNAVHQQPDNVNYLYEYGKLLIEAGRETDAVPMGDHAIQIAPNDPRGYAIKARALVYSDPTTAIPTAVNGLEADPNFAALHAVLAIAYTNIGRYQEALTRGQKAVELDPLDAVAHRSYSYALIYVGRYQQAIDQLQQAIDLNPRLTAPYFELAQVYKVQKDMAMGIAIYQHILEIEPNSAKAYQRMCATYVEVGQFQQGEPFCDKAIDIDPNYSDAYKVLGQLQYARRNYEGAIATFQKCRDLGSTSIECYYLQGLAYYFLADTPAECDLAWNTLQDALTRAQAQQELPQTIDSIKTGLYNITVHCTGYANRPLPTDIPPTTIPPTPIGGGA
jgi:tetratricopeptide (TPR) repeat protein